MLAVELLLPGPSIGFGLPSSSSVGASSSSTSWPTPSPGRTSWPLLASREEEEAAPSFTRRKLSHLPAKTQLRGAGSSRSPGFSRSAVLTEVKTGRRTSVAHWLGETFMELIVHSTLLMSFSLASLVPFVQMECGAALDFRPFWTGASESIAVYTLDHLRDIRRASGESSAVGHRRGLAARRPILLQVLLVAALAGFISTLLAYHSWRLACTFGGHLLLCAAYAKLKRKMPYMKALYVSLCVVYMAFAAPAAFVPGLLTFLTGAQFARLLLLIFCVAFTIEHLQDVRDVEEDRQAGVVTVPSGLGTKRARWVLLGVQAACFSAQSVISWAAGLPLRPGFVAMYVVCCLCAVTFSERTPRSFFQVLLEPLYGAPLALRAFGLLLGSP